MSSPGAVQPRSPLHAPTSSLPPIPPESRGRALSGSITNGHTSVAASLGVQLRKEQNPRDGKVGRSLSNAGSSVVRRSRNLEKNGMYTGILNMVNCHCMYCGFTVHMVDTLLVSFAMITGFPYSQLG